MIRALYELYPNLEKPEARSQKRSRKARSKKREGQLLPIVGAAS